MADYYFPRCRELRVHAHLSVNKLAAESSVDRSTIARIEKNQGVTELSAFKVLAPLKAHHPEIGDDEIIVK